MRTKKIFSPLNLWCHSYITNSLQQEVLYSIKYAEVRKLYLISHKQPELKIDLKRTHHAVSSIHWSCAILTKSEVPCKHGAYNMLLIRATSKIDKPSLSIGQVHGVSVHDKCGQGFNPHCIKLYELISPKSLSNITQFIQRYKLYKTKTRMYVDESTDISKRSMPQTIFAPALFLSRQSFGLQKFHVNFFYLGRQVSIIGWSFPKFELFSLLFAFSTLITLFDYDFIT